MKESTRKYYVYYLIDPKDALPFYIGKGNGDRMYIHESETKAGIIPNDRNLYLFNSIKEILNNGQNVIYKKIIDNIEESEAFSIEMSEIKKYGRKNNGSGILCNMTDGGEGVSGLVFTEIQRKKISDSLKGRPTWASTHKEEFSKLITGEKNPFYGKTHSEKTKEKIRKSLKETFVIFGHPLKGKPKSEEHKKKISEYQKGRKLSEKTKKKMSDSQNKRCIVDDKIKNIIIKLYKKGAGCKKIIKIIKQEYNFPYSIALVKKTLISVGYNLNDKNSPPKKVKIIFKDNTELTFDSIAKAGKYLKCGAANLSKYISRKRKTNKFEAILL